MRSYSVLLCLAPPLLACTVAGTVGIGGATTDASDTSGRTETGADTGVSDDGQLFDLGPGADLCKIPGGMEIRPCTQQAPPDTFDARREWAWPGKDADRDSFVIPLVGNLTDDNHDGAIDLCDVPDIILLAGPSMPQNPMLGMEPAHLYVLDGASGSVHFTSTEPLSPTTTPALGDIDGDGAIEIIAVQNDGAQAGPFSGHLIAFDGDGSVMWKGDSFDDAWTDSVALADLDADGDVEIMVADVVADHEGRVLFQAAEGTSDDGTPFGVDLDDDGDLEVLWGRSAYHHTGQLAWVQADIDHGFAQVADLDDDGDPEIIVTTPDGISVLAHDGTRLIGNQLPLPVPAGPETWKRPAAIHDLDGFGRPDFAMSVREWYATFHASLSDGVISVQWQAPVADWTGAAGGTAFDFLGDRTAEAMYADEWNLFVYDELGAVLLTDTRTSRTIHEYPVVADVDNDGSAEIAVISNAGFGPDRGPTVAVFGQRTDRWVPALRIWNQHTFHATNVFEDGRIPMVEPQHWKLLNTFRTSAQVEDGWLCQPEP